MQPRVLLVGDSITQESFYPNGWGAALAVWYARKADVINRGFDGWNTRWILRNKDAISASLGPAPAGTYLLGTLMLGANDNSTSYQNVPIDEYEANLRKLAIWMTSEVGVTRLLIMAPPPFHAETHAAFRGYAVADAPRSDERHEQYGDRAKAVAAELGVGFVSLRDALQDALGDEWPSALHDGLHLSDAGNRIAFAAVQKAVTEQFPDIVPSALTKQLLPDFEFMEQHRDGVLP